jgi:glyoxylase-like metal-dependent hydrolase (beta-lactamase superfamily II)
LFGRETALEETRQTLERIVDLHCDIVIPGHGRPFGEVDAALARAFSRLKAYEEDITRLARHVVKVLFTFVMLEKRSMPLAEVPAYLERVAILAEINHRYLKMAPAAFSDWLIADLEQAGALERRSSTVVASR